MPRDRRTRRDLHALDENGMVLCNPRDREAAHRAEMEGIATTNDSAVTCRKCRDLRYQRDKSRKEGRLPVDTREPDPQREAQDGPADRPHAGS